jgi:hypothetical protein
MRKHALNMIVLVIATAMFVMSVWQHELLVIGFVWGTGGTCNEVLAFRVEISPASHSSFFYFIMNIKGHVF